MKNSLNRRKFIGTSLIASAGLALKSNKIWGAPNYIPSLFKPNSKINGVQLGMITYSFREMEDQSAEATLKNVLECNISAIELMGDIADTFAGAPKNPINRRKYYRFMRGNLEGTLTQDQKNEMKEMEKEIKAYNEIKSKWRENTSMKSIEKLRKMYNDAGVSIYAFKPSRLLGPKNTDAEIKWAMLAGKTLGASHVTVEHTKDEALTLKLGQIAKQLDIFVAYHGHAQQTPILWDTVLKQSTNNAINLDLGHYVAAGNTKPLQILKDHHKEIKSIHIKDRQNPENGKKNMSFGKGDTPIIEALQLIRDKKYNFPATIEYEYETPKNSTIIAEIQKCVEYCTKALQS